MVGNGGESASQDLHTASRPLAQAPPTVWENRVGQTASCRRRRTLRNLWIRDLRTSDAVEMRLAPQEDLVAGKRR